MFFDVYLFLCESTGKTPNGVAKELGFASSSVTQWKHGSVPRPAALQKISEYFGVTVEYLIDGTAENKKSPAPKSAELIPGYSDLTEENKAKVRDYIALLAMSEQKD